MRCRGCLNRREFLAVTGGVAVAALAACEPDVTIPTSPHTVVTVASFVGLATTGLLVQVQSTIAARRTGPDSFEAFSMYCTHQGCVTGLATTPSGAQQFSCPCHGSQFNANGGVLAGPADRSLAQLPTSYNAATDELTIN